MNAHDFTFPAIDQGEINLADYSGKTVLNGPHRLVSVLDEVLDRALVLAVCPAGEVRRRTRSGASLPGSFELSDHQFVSLG